MSSIFSMPKFAKNFTKRALPTRSSSSVSVTASTVSKEKNGTPKSNTIALPVQHTPPTNHVVFTAPKSESPKAGPYKELEPAPVPQTEASSTAETTTTVVEVEPLPKDEPIQEPVHSIAAVPPIVSEISEPDKTLEPAVTFVEEPGYDVVSEPETKKSEVEWTEAEPSPSGEVKQEVENLEVVPVDVSLATTTTSTTDSSSTSTGSNDIVAPSPDIPQQDGAFQSTTETEVVSSELVAGLTQKIQDVEAALHATQDELDTKSRTIEDLLAKIDIMHKNIANLEKSKEETSEEVKQEKNDLVEEIHRLKGIIGVERLDNREKIDSLVVEKEAVEAKLDIQQALISRLEERLADGREETEGVYARNRDLESLLRQYEEVSKKDENDTNLVAEKESQIRMLKKNNEKLSSQLVQLQSNLNNTERLNRTFLDQLRRQSNEIQTQARKTPLGRLGSTIWGMTGGSRVESAIFTMKSLNEDIFQTAAALTDQLETIPKRFVEDEGTSAKAEILKSMLGLELVDALQKEAKTSSEDSNTFFVQIALQGCLTASCMRIITSWYPTEWEYGNLLVALYERIRGTGGPEIALNWKKATQQSCTPSTDRNTKLVGFLTEQVQAVLLVGGWSTQSPVEELLKAKYAQNLAGIVFHALRLNGLITATGENRDVEGFSVDAGKMFDPNQMTNDSPFDDIARESKIGSTPDEEVICTTALGLKSADIDSTKPDQILLKPKVFLRGGLL